MRLDLLSIIVAALALGVSIWTQWQRRQDKARDALPIARVHWSTGKAGRAARVTLVNRLNEDLLVSHVEAKARLMECTSTYDPSTGKTKESFAPKSSSEPLEWRVLALSRDEQTFRIEGLDSPCWIRITISSSNSTLRRKRITLSST